VVTEAALTEYLDEIRKQVCTKCVERPPGGPPCAPLGKPCGIELHLPQLIDAIHEVHSPLIAPYLDRNQQQICQKCVLHHSSPCPCPMESLAVLLVEAVETVDRRRERRESREPDLADMVRVKEKSVSHRLLAGRLRPGAGSQDSGDAVAGRHLR
jgi:hypothetical protein